MFIALSWSEIWRMTLVWRQKQDRPFACYSYFLSIALLPGDLCSRNTLVQSCLARTAKLKNHQTSPLCTMNHTAIAGMILAE